MDQLHNARKSDSSSLGSSRRKAGRDSPAGRHLPETFARARKVFNPQQIVDLTAVAGNYVMVAMMLAMAEETVPPGKEPPFKVGEK